MRGALGFGRRDNFGSRDPGCVNPRSVNAGCVNSGNVNSGRGNSRSVNSRSVNPRRHHSGWIGSERVHPSGNSGCVNSSCVVPRVFRPGRPHRFLALRRRARLLRTTWQRARRKRWGRFGDGHAGERPRRFRFDRFRLAHNGRPVRLRCASGLRIPCGAHRTQRRGRLPFGRRWPSQIEVGERTFRVPASNHRIARGAVGVARREVVSAVPAPGLGLKAQVVTFRTFHRRWASAARPVRSRLLARRSCWICTRSSSAADRAGLSGPTRSST